MQAASDGGTPAYIRGNYPLYGITRGIAGVNRSPLGDLGNSGHNGRGFLVLTFVIVLAPRGKQWRMAPKTARGSRLKPGPQERRPLDSQPLVRGGFPGIAALETPAADSDTGPIRDVAELTGDGDSTGPGRLASSDSGGLLQLKTDVGSRFLDIHQTVSCIAGALPQASVSCLGGNGLAAALEGEIDQSLYAPGSQSNVGLAQEVVTGAGYCEQAAAAAYLLPSTNPPNLACTLGVIRDYRQGREDSLVQGEVGENCFSLSGQSQDSDEDSISPSIDSETCDSSTAPLTPISVLRGTAVKCQSKRAETITSQHKQTQRDSKKARVATKQLQVAISKVAKTCSEIGERIVAVECRADVLESDLGAVAKQAAMHETQLSDIQWKVEDFENRQRRNNLRLIGIQEAMSMARCCIASDWLETTPPTFNHWLARMCSMFYLEMGAYACKGRGRRRMGEAIWAPFAQWLGNN
ncbi:hypothetical protein NDU88_001545 [Pleurodeles waltl]|uniref:Uncharacterized protein n=1 Tax=Pleurodeles waltl TaxID=8319 RepID=A0AAV7LBA9_PLEWA|nr:hypothetical protein NDU88_001545 [Pleurodeles waltl]